MTIRKANINDAKKLLEYLYKFLSENCITVPSLSFRPDLEQEKKWIESRTGEKGVIFIAEENEKIIGLIETTLSTTEEFKHNCEFGMSVLAPYRKRGIGKKLLEKFLEWADNSNLQRIELNVFSINENVIRLYKNYGFAEDGRRMYAVKLFDGNYCDLVHMYKFNKYTNLN